MVAELATTSQVILTQDSPNGQLGIECIAYVARDSGQHRLTVTSLGGSGDGQAGSIEIHVIAHRIATSADRIHSDVEHSLAAAEQFRLKNTAASRAEAIDLFRAPVCGTPNNWGYTMSSRSPHTVSVYLICEEAHHARPFHLLSRRWRFFSASACQFTHQRLWRLEVRSTGSEISTKHVNTIVTLLSTIRRQALLLVRASPTTDIAESSMPIRQIGNLRFPNIGWLLSFFRDVRDTPREGVALYNIGVSYVSLGDFARAIGYLLQSLDIRTKLKDVAGQAEALTDLGRAEMGRGDQDTALSYLRRALMAREVVGDRRSEGLTRVVLSDAYFSIGQAEQAREAAETAAALLQVTDDRRTHALALLSFARASAAGELRRGGRCGAAGIRRVCGFWRHEQRGPRLNGDRRR